MSKIFVVVIALLVIACVGQFPPPPPSPSTAIPQTVVESEVIVQRKDWVNLPEIFSPFGVIRQTDSTLEEPYILSSNTKPDEVDTIANNYVYGFLHEENTEGKDVDYYTLELTGNGNPAIYNAPFFGYPMIPACKAYKNLILNVLLLGPVSVPDSFVGTNQISSTEVPDWVQLPANTKILSSSKLDVNNLACDFFEPTASTTYCVPSTIVDTCAVGFPATTVMTSPPYTPYCDFSTALSANYDPTSPTGVYGQWPAGNYTMVVYESDGLEIDYVLHLGYKGLLEAALPYLDQTFNPDFDIMPGNLARTYGQSVFWLDMIRYTSYVHVNKCKDI